MDARCWRDNIHEIHDIQLIFKLKNESNLDTLISTHWKRRLTIKASIGYNAGQILTSVRSNIGIGYNAIGYNAGFVLANIGEPNVLIGDNLNF